MNISLKPMHHATVSAMTKLPRGKVLDIAAGGGGVAKKLQSLGFDVVGCDIEPQYCEKLGVVCHPVDLNSQPLPFLDDEFDYLIFNESIQYLENPYHLFREINRVSHPGTQLFTTFPNILHIQSRIKYLLNGYPDFFKPCYSTPVDDDAFRKIGIHPISLVEYKLMLDHYGWTVTQVSPSRYKTGIFFYLIIALPILLMTYFSTLTKRREIRRFKRILNSWAVLMGEGLLVISKKYDTTAS